MYLTRGQILQAEDLERREVPVPEWGGTLLVRALTGAERGRIEADSLRQNGRGVTFSPQSIETLRAKVVAMAAIDEDGTSLFTLRDVEALAGKSGAVLERLFDVVAEMSGISAGAIEELTANFEPGPSDDSGSTSR